ncbi:MAG: ATP-binding protein, partial [Erysipelotrichaceae bacterium]
KLKLLIQHINVGFWKMYCSFPILVIAYIFFHFFNGGEFKFERSDTISFTFIVGIIIYVYIILFNSLVIQYKKIVIDNEMQTFKVISDSQKSYYQMLNNKVKDAAIFRHDFKHNIGVLNSLINDKDFKALKTYMTSLSNKLDESAIIKYTSDNTLNAIISHYEHQAEYNEIETNIKIMISDDINIDIYDLCIVIGNLFENAVEACCRMGFKGRSIDIIMEVVNDYLIIKVKNSFNGVIKLDNDRYVTSKKHGGIGLSSINGIVNKYNGNIKIDNVDNEFSVQVALAIKKDI